MASVDSDFTIYRARDKRCINNTLRQCLGRFIRKTLSFSKSLQMHESVI
ncbi:MAG: hypothetical protein EKK69_00795 [Candidatus Competibacteraceae bacterium]|nr:MAG: hypothetical protein EKK69_00795 [Candidatus Competibacteraceae bacterium]